MSYNQKDWLNKIRSRTDLSSFVHHMTKGNNERDDVENLVKILNDRMLYGSSTKSGYIVGENTAVCFQDVPVTGLAQNVYDNKKRYSSSGLGFTKEYIYCSGGRPVIYEDTDYAKTFLPEYEWWRIVNFNLSDEKNYIDWTHEKEWRIKGNFNFDINEVHVILHDWKQYEKFVKIVQENDINILKDIAGIILLEPIIS